MADLRIVDAQEIPTENITGEEKLPTGGSGNYSISLDSLADYTKTKKDLADNTSVDGKVNGVRQELDAHIEDLLNPHQVTKGQIGLGNVDNTADADKPVSNSTQAAIISATSPKADKTYVDTQLTLKANKVDVYTKSETYTKQESSDLVNSSISTALTPVNASLELAKRGIANLYDPSLTYNSGERVVLTNGDIVKSTIDGNTNDPNVDMTGWVKTNSASQIFDESGLTQQFINDGVESIAELIAIQNPKNGTRMYIKGFHKPTNFALAQPYKGGGEFIYNSTKASINDGICCFNGWERQGITDFVTPEMAGAKRDNSTDDIEAFEIAGMYAFTNRIRRVLLGSGYYVVSRGIKAYAGVSYYQRGVTYQGQGKGATYILVNGGGNGIEIVRGDGGTTGQITNVKICDLTLESKTYQVGIGIHSTTNISGIYLDEINLINWEYATKFDNTFYICSFTGLFASLCKNGFHNGATGTTLWIDRCYVQSGGSTTDTSAPSAFKLNAAYSTIGSLACDNYAGIAYNFDFGSSSVGSLGIERSTTNTNPYCEMVKFAATSMVIDNFYLLNTEGLTSTNTIFSNSASKVEIGNVRIANNNSAITTCPAIFSNVSSTNANSFKANTSFKSLKFDVTFADYVPATSSRAATTTTQIDHVKYLYGRYRPYVGLYDKQSEIDAMFGASQNIAKTSMFFDIYGDSFRYSGYTGEYDGRYQVAPLLGDWGIQRRPDIHGIAAVVNLKEGASDINSILPSESACIPLISRKLPSAPTYGAFHLNTTSKVMNTWDGSTWMEVATPTLRYSGMYNPPSIAANTVFKYELALEGVTPSHFVQVAFSIDNSDIEITARAGTDKIYIYFKNLSAASIDLASGTLKVLAKL